MEVLFLTIFVSLALVSAAALFFAWNVRQRTHEQGDRLVLLPLVDDLDTSAGSSEGDRSEREGTTARMDAQENRDEDH